MNFGPTLNKKTQDCLVILCLFKELATRHILNYNCFSIKNHATYIIWTTLTRQYFYAKIVPAWSTQYCTVVCVILAVEVIC